MSRGSLVGPNGGRDDRRDVSRPIPQILACHLTKENDSLHNSPQFSAVLRETTKRITQKNTQQILAPEISYSGSTSNVPTKMLDFRRFDSSIILISRGGIPRPVGDFPESLTRAMLVGTMLIGRLCV